MEIISESLQVENKELLPQVLMRIFTVCKSDPNFPLKENIKSVEGEVVALQKKIKRQRKLVEETVNLRNDLSNRLQILRQENFELKSKLLEDLGSEV